MIKYDQERKARFDQQRPSARERGYDSKWQKEAKAFLALHPYCRMCGAPSRVVDHVIPHRGDKRLFWQRSNWQALCTPCHSSRKQREERR
jgi:5-methylcytosine-specific restriction endonuclease McrA